MLSLTPVATPPSSLAAANGARALGCALVVATCCLFTSSAHGAQKCETRAVVGVSFGAYDVFDPTPLRAAGSVTIRCNGNWDYVVLIQLGAGSAGGFAPRQMRSGTATLAYNLFLDAAGGTVWGDGSAGTRAWGPTSLPPHHNHTIPVFGVVPARQDVAVGSYTDSVAVTIVF